MTGRGNGQYDDRIRTRAMVVDRQPSNRPIGHADRRLDARGGGIQAVADAERLGFLGRGDIFAPTGPGGVAGQSPNGKCRLKKQFENLRDGDRFWYENDLQNDLGLPELVDILNIDLSQTRLAHVIIRNTDIARANSGRTYSPCPGRWLCLPACSCLP